MSEVDAVLLVAREQGWFLFDIAEAVHPGKEDELWYEAELALPRNGAPPPPLPVDRTFVFDLEIVGGEGRSVLEAVAAAWANVSR